MCSSRLQQWQRSRHRHRRHDGSADHQEAVPLGAGQSRRIQPDREFRFCRRHDLDGRGDRPACSASTVDGGKRHDVGLQQRRDARWRSRQRHADRMEGNDTYIFGLGYGQDVINEDGQGSFFAGGVDRVLFNPDVAPEDVQLAASADGNDLIMTIAGTGDQLRSRCSSAPCWRSPIRRIQPDRELRVCRRHDLDRLRRWISERCKRSRTAGNDAIWGYNGAETLNGGAGNDTLKGWTGDDTYVFGRGYGHDVDRRGRRRLRPSAADGILTRSHSRWGLRRTDLLFSRKWQRSRHHHRRHFRPADNQDAIPFRHPQGSDTNRIENFVFADGTAWTAARTSTCVYTPSAVDDRQRHDTGYNGAEMLDGGAGNDTLMATPARTPICSAAATATT